MSSKNPLDKWETKHGRKVKAMCFKRDKAANARCIWCGNPIDYGLGPYDGRCSSMAWSPEHIRPRSKYPELALDPANIAAAHWKCNAKRMSRAGLTNLGDPSREW